MPYSVEGQNSARTQPPQFPKGNPQICGRFFGGDVPDPEPHTFTATHLITLFCISRHNIPYVVSFMRRIFLSILLSVRFKR
jgi:hypothetical protein